jgi:hypothetical protein
MDLPGALLTVQESWIRFANHSLATSGLYISLLSSKSSHKVRFFGGEECFLTKRRQLNQGWKSCTVPMSTRIRVYAISIPGNCAGATLSFIITIVTVGYHGYCTNSKVVPLASLPQVCASAS